MVKVLRLLMEVVERENITVIQTHHRMATFYVALYRDKAISYFHFTRSCNIDDETTPGFTICKEQLKLVGLRFGLHSYIHI